jgi:hypothetical protein
VLSRVLRLRTCLPPEEGSDAAMCLTVLDPASSFGRAPVQSRVPRLSEGTPLAQPYN